MSPLRTWVIRLGVVGAILGPVGGAAALLFGNIALWGADGGGRVFSYRKPDADGGLHRAARGEPASALRVDGAAA